MPGAENGQQIVARFAVPPRKVVCGFYNTLFIQNNLEEAPTDEAGERDAAHPKREEEPKPEVCAHGGNMYNLMSLTGKFKKQKGSQSNLFPDVLETQKVQCKDLATYGEPYEVACGTNHAMFLLKKPDKVGGVLFGAGLGNRGRLAMKQPGEEEDDEIEDTWWTEEGMMGPITLGPGTPPLSVLRVDCGSDHTIAFCTDGRLYGWGANKEGQCGITLPAPSLEFDDVKWPMPIRFPGSKTINHFAVGGQHSLAILEGELFAWGCGRNGRLGRGRFGNVSTPQPVSALGESLCLFVACGESHSGMIDQTGKAWTWGAGSYGRLGHGEEIDVQVPKQVEYFDEIETPGQIKIQTIALGGYHSLFLEEPNAMSGRLFSCGSGLGVGLLSSESDPMTVKQPRLITDSVLGTKGSIKQIAAGMNHNYVLQENGDLVRWGSGANGRLGQTDNKVRSMCQPSVHKNNRKGFIMKATPEATQVHLYTHPTERPEKQKVEKAADAEEQANAACAVRQVACGTQHTMALIKGGQLYVWGSNANGQMGPGVDPDGFCAFPRKITVGPGRYVKEIAAGFEHCLVVTGHSECWAWGRGTAGQLGLGRARNSYEPMHVSDLTQVITIAAGEEHSAAICADLRGVYELWTWGSAENGMLGLGEDFTSGPQANPQKVQFEEGSLRAAVKPVNEKNRKAGQPALVNTAAAGSGQLEPMRVRCGNNHTVVIVSRRDGPALEAVGRDVTKDKASRVENKLFSFGAGWFGRLGLGASQNGNEARRPGSGSNVHSPKEVKFQDAGCVFTVEVGCGAYHTCSLNRQGELFAWGRKELICQKEHLDEPRKFMQIEAGVKSVVCGEMHTCAINEKGELWIWGYNKSGHFGVNSRLDSLLAPVQVTQLPAACIMVGTGTAHTMMVCGGGVIFACGDQGCGRLGLENKEVKEKCVVTPQAVKTEWASIQSMAAGAAEKKEAPRSLEDLYATDVVKEEEKAPQTVDQDLMSAMLLQLQGGQKVDSFGTMQALIKQEQEGSRPKKLKSLEDDLAKRIGEEVQEMKNKVKQERVLKELENDLQQSLESNMKWFGKACTTPETGNLRVSQEVVTRLPIYEELIWVLQQQVNYLARLANVVGDDQENRKVFYEIVEGIYKESDTDTRTRHLFLMCMRLMFVNEIDAVARLQLDKVFDKDKSRAFHVFSKYALSSVHWKDVLHRYLKVADETRKGKAQEKEEDLSSTLLAQFKTASVDKVFAIGYADLADFFESVGEARKETQELQALYSQSLDGFREFMTTCFVDSVTQVQLPEDMRKLLNFIHCDVMARQPTMGKIDQEIPQELKAYEPLLYLFVHCILIKVTRQVKHYATKKCLLGAAALVVESDAYTVNNMQRAAMFLERMVNDFDFPEKEMRPLVSAAKKVKVRLLEYLRAQTEITNDLEAITIVETYNSQFERTRHMVFLQVGTVMKLSNMLKFYDSQLRLSAVDRMADLISRIPKWSPQEIAQAEEKGVSCILNFVMQHRFLLKTTEVIKICPSSSLPVPANMTSIGAVAGFFKTYQLDNPDDPRRELESLFLELDGLNSKTFPEMKVEFEERRMQYRSGGSPNYELMQRLQDGLRIVEELENVQARPDDVLNWMSKELLNRDRHFKYLQIIKNQITKMEATKKDYEKNIARWTRELELAVEQSRALSLPETYQNAAQTSLTRLKFTEIAKSNLNKRLLDPSKAKGLNLTYTPIRTEMLKKLEKRGIVTEIFKPFQDAEMRKTMQVTIRMTPDLPGGGVQIVVDVCNRGNKTTVKTLNIPDNKVSDMKTADKGEKAKLANEGEDPFMEVDCTEFVKYCTELAQSTG